MPVFSFCLEYNITDRPESFCWVRRTPRYRHSPNTRHQRVIIIIFLSPLSVWVWWCGLRALISMQFLYESFVWIIWFHLLHQANRVIGFFFNNWNVFKSFLILPQETRDETCDAFTGREVPKVMSKWYFIFQDRPKKCNNPKVCNLWHKSGVRYMRTCQPCPEVYPWTGKSGIRSSRIDNDNSE